MTERLYYTEPYRKTFDATVVTVESVDGRSHVTLDQTAFYPTSGGQPFDTGTLGGAAVSDVIDRDDGTIAHVVGGSLKAGDVVTGEIDWARRFDHMQQHTGQHVLSAAFDRLFGVRTESFHMGQLSATIDLAREVTAAEVAKAEDDANRVVWEDRPVSVRFATAEEAAAMPLRKESGRTGSLRLIDVQNYDLSACGGTHVERTGAIGVIAIGGWEKFRGGSRVEFLCGIRALQRFRVWRDAMAAMQKHLSVAPIEMAASIERMHDEAKGMQTHDPRFSGKARGSRSRRVTGERFDDDRRSAGGLGCPGTEGDCRGSNRGSTGSSRGVVYDYDTSASSGRQGRELHRVDAGAVLKQLTAKFGGKGGGKPDLAQGGGLNASDCAIDRSHSRNRRGGTLDPPLRQRGAILNAPSSLNHFAVQHLVLEDVTDERAVFRGPAEARRERHLLSQRHARRFGQSRQQRRIENSRRDCDHTNADRPRTRARLAASSRQCRPSRRRTPAGRSVRRTPRSTRC